MSTHTELSSPSEACEPPAPRGKSVADVLLSGVAALMIGAALLLLLFGGPGDGEVAPAVAAPPPIELLSPSAGETVGNPVVVEFHVPEVLRYGAGGWGTRGAHLHLGLNGTAVMPTSADVLPRENNRYQWVVPVPQAGEYSLQLFWSDADHRALEAGASERVRIRVGPVGGR